MLNDSYSKGRLRSRQQMNPGQQFATLQRANGSPHGMQLQTINYKTAIGCGLGPKIV